MSGGLPVLAAGLLLAAGVGAALSASRLHVPELVLFLGLGMAVGADGAGWIRFSDYGLARDFGTLALALILFDGGLNTGFGSLRAVLRPALRLAVVGTVGTALITGLLASAILGMPLLHGLLLGSILASTDSAAVFALVRETAFRRRVSRTLEGESGFNDPVAVLLVLGFIGWIEHPANGLAGMGELLVTQLLGGLACGLLAGGAAAWALQRISPPAPGLYPVLSVSAAALAYGGATSLHGSGFLAVYLAGLLLADAPIRARQTIGLFHQGGAWIAQVSLFLILGLLVSPAGLALVAPAGIVVSILVLFARMLAALVATVPDRFTPPERLVIGWAGLRGAVPVVLATFPVTAGVANGDRLFSVVFLVVVITAVAQGATVERLAKALRVTSSEPALPRPLAERGTIRRLGAEVLEYPVSAVDGVVGRQVSDLGLPPQATVSVIVRKGQAIPPTGAVRIRAGDRLHMLVRQEVAGEMAELMDAWEDEGSRYG